MTRTIRPAIDVDVDAVTELYGRVTSIRETYTPAGQRVRAFQFENGATRQFDHWADLALIAA
jgi:hypothetical protein